MQQSEWIKEDIDSLKDGYQNLKSELFQKIDELEEFVALIEKQVVNTVRDSGERLGELETFRRIQEIKSSLSDVRKESQAALIASRWLRKYHASLIQCGCNAVFDLDYHFRDQELQHLTISREGYQFFRQDLDIYLQWIAHYLGLGGKIPRPILSGLIRSPIDYKFYIQAFQAIKREKIGKASALELPDDALELMYSYINRSMIDREFQVD